MPVSSARMTSDESTRATIARVIGSSTSQANACHSPSVDGAMLTPQRL